jgi:hypothetical protein
MNEVCVHASHNTQILVRNVGIFRDVIPSTSLNNLASSIHVQTITTIFFISQSCVRA